MNFTIEVDLPDEYKSLLEDTQNNIFMAQYSVKERSSIKHKINVVDVNSNIIDSVDILECYLNNDYWKVILNLKDKGFAHESPFLIINLSIFSTKLIYKMLDIMCNKHVHTWLIEDIKLNYLLKMYCNEDIYTIWRTSKQIYDFDEEPDYNDVNEVEKWIKRNIHPRRWCEVGLERIYEFFHTDQYIKVSINIYYKDCRVYNIEQCYINKEILSGRNLDGTKIYDLKDIKDTKLSIFNSSKAIWLYARRNYYGDPISFGVNLPKYIVQTNNSSGCFIRIVSHNSRQYGDMIAFPYASKGIIRSHRECDITIYFNYHTQIPDKLSLFNILQKKKPINKKITYTKDNNNTSINYRKLNNVRYINQPRK